MNEPLLRVRDLCVDFGAQPVINSVNFDLYPGETLGLVGESGSGKSTLARAILRLLPARGRVEFMGTDLLKSSASSLRARRRELQIVFQDPLASLDPRMRLGEAIAEPLQVFEPGVSAKDRRLQVGEMLERVGLRADMAMRYPHELSGGQCQRVGIARAMILGPKLLICDEAVSSLDASIQGQIVNLLLDLQQDTGMAMLFISHNLAVVRHLSHRVLVIYLGRLVEIAPCEALFALPTHPYTRALLASVPQLPPGGSVALGAPRAERSLSAQALVAGCAYRNRCPYALPLCDSSVPALAEVKPAHWVACHRSHEVLNPLSFAA
jgi:oligopeptide transport system ATP-binding protein